MMERGRQIPQQLGITNFKGTNGWLEKWKMRYNVKQIAICGESGDVQEETVVSLIERLKKTALMKQGASGGSYLIVDLAKSVRNARGGGREARRGSQ